MFLCLQNRMPEHRSGALQTTGRIFKQSKWARNRVGIGLSYRLARIHRAGEIDSLESIFGLFKSLKIRAQS
jgi:hypothetical protein